MNCPWILDLDDWFSEVGQLTVRQIRLVCQCKECKDLREDECSVVEPA